MIGAGIGFGVGEFLAIPVSQHVPVFGTWEKLGEPWSPARLSLIPIHLFAFGLAGVLLGGLIAHAIRQVNRGA